MVSRRGGNSTGWWILDETQSQRASASPTGCGMELNLCVARSLVLVHVVYSRDRIAKMSGNFVGEAIVEKPPQAGPFQDTLPSR